MLLLVDTFEHSSIQSRDYNLRKHFYRSLSKKLEYQVQLFHNSNIFAVFDAQRRSPIMTFLYGFVTLMTDDLLWDDFT